MANETVKSLAVEIQISVERLVQQFADAGIEKTENDTVSQNEKETLLVYLNRNGGVTTTQTTKLILQRKIRSTLNIQSAGGRSKSINVEVRKKRAYIANNTSEKEKLKEQLGYQEEVKGRAEKIKYEVTEKEKVKESKNNQKITQLKQDALQNMEKQRRAAEAAEIKNRIEKETQSRVEAASKKIFEEVCRMEEENLNHWNTFDEIEDNLDTYSSTFHYAPEVEEEDSIQEEGHRIRNRIARTTRHKKNNKHFEKADREEERAIGRASKSKAKQKKTSSLKKSFIKPVVLINRNIIIGETISVAELANKMAIKGSEVIKTMMKMGAMVTINQVIDQETAQLVAEEMGHKVILRRESELEEAVLSDRDIGAAIAEARAPVVTIMGHVDHGKTSLLDYIRSTKVAFSEAGGITQHIGAYHVETDKGVITFLDTPGHAAFSLMRARGAKVTDIIVLVVAADDGVMPQTIEAIHHAQGANVPVIVAINKIDKKTADPDRVKNELSKYNIVPEEWGGETQFINISAKKGIGVDILLEAILLQAELLELKAIHTGMASGIVIESYLDKGRGSVATILVQEGTLNKGDIVLCGFEYGRIRAMRNELGEEIYSAGPSMPVEILGLSNVPSVGEKAMVVRDEKKAREVAFYRQGKFREVKLARQQKLKLENMFADIKDNSKVSELNIILKTDVQGSCEAIIDSLQKLPSNEVKIKIVASGVGAITETDVTLAVASNAIIIGFNVRADASAKRIVESENLDLRYYSVIYTLIDEIKKAMSGMLEPEYKQQIIGLAEVRSIFKSPKFGIIAGCMVLDGTIKRNNPIRILRNNIVINEGKIESLRRFKDDVNEVSNGMECGIAIKNYNDIRLSDMIEVFEFIEVKRSIDN